MDRKIYFMKGRFFTPDDQRAGSVDGISWALNFGSSELSQINGLLGNPKVMMSREGTNVILLDRDFSRNRFKRLGF